MADLDLLLIVPHPDDEVFGCGGLFARMADHGRPVGTLTLTRGRAGRSLGLVPPHELADKRERELLASLRELGVAWHRIEDFHDYVPDDDRGIDRHPGLRGEPRADLVAVVRGAIEETRPRVVLTFPPNGANGHPDHVVCHDVVITALDASDHRPDALYYYAGDKPYEGPDRDGFWESEAIRAAHLYPTHYLDVGPYLEAKLRALGQHETQALSVLTFLRRFGRRMMVESFHRARPAMGDAPPRSARFL